MSEPLVRFQLEGPVAILTLDDGKANALSHAMVVELNAALDRAAKEAKAVVIAGRPERFSAGFDLKVMTKSPEDAKALLTVGRDLLLRLYGLPQPVVAACTGHAIAGGALMLLTADERIGAAGAFRIGLNEVAIGMPLPYLGMELVRDRLDGRELVHATLHAEMYGPEDAKRVGFLDQVVPPSEVLAQSVAVAAKLGAYSSVAFHGTKRRLRERTIDRILSSFDADMGKIAFGG